MSTLLVVEATSVADYLTRYYKPERLRNVDDAYGAGSLLARYQDDFERDGYVSTSHHDNVTGTFICWPCLPAWAAKPPLCPTFDLWLNGKLQVVGESLTVVERVAESLRGEGDPASEAEEVADSIRLRP